MRGDSSPSVNSSPELAGSGLGSSAPECASFGTPRSIPTPAPSCVSIGQASRTMETCDLFAPEQSSDPTSSVADSPAKISRSRAVVGVLKASAAAYGASSVELWAIFDRDSLSWKTSARSLLEASPKFSETLPRSGMTRNGTLYRLPPLTRLIYGNAVGSLLPTPTDASKGGGSSRSGDRINETPTLQGMARKGMLLPTPTAEQYGTTNNGKRGDGTTYNTAGTPSLHTAAKRGLLPTPTAGDAKSSGSRNTTQSKAHPGVSLTDWGRQDGGAGRLLPTPKASDGGAWNPPNSNGPNLAHAARLLPTPRASEYKGTGPLGSKSHTHRVSHGYLDATMQEATGKTGRLNPRFVEAMMGFPIGHTECEYSVSRLSRKLRK